MALAVLDPKDFTENGLFTEDSFLQKTGSYDFSRFTGKNVLIRGCGLPIPPWAYMLLTARLVGIARSVRYGNEHDNITVYRHTTKHQNPVAPEDPNV